MRCRVSDGMKNRASLPLVQDQSYNHHLPVASNKKVGKMGILPLSRSSLGKPDVKEHSIRTTYTCYKTTGRDKLVKEGSGLASPFEGWEGDGL